LTRRKERVSMPDQGKGLLSAPSQNLLADRTSGVARRLWLLVSSAYTYVMAFGSQTATHAGSPSQ
jgi:hypothetical protein